MRGLLMPIGGAEDKYAACEILTQFIRICGGNKANILILPSASAIPYDVADEYEYLFSALGVRRVQSLHILDRQDANKPNIAKMFDGITGLFISGGDQLKLSSLIGDTVLSEVIHQRFLEGLHIGGTSAGASVMSREMIAFGRDIFNPTEGLIHMSLGLGLSQDLIIDQHFSQRNRLKRLQAAVERYPHLTGIGIDEDTALIISPDNSWQVIGAGTVTVVEDLNHEPRVLHPVMKTIYEPLARQASNLQFS